jgi:hypothetical protein
MVLNTWLEQFKKKGRRSNLRGQGLHRYLCSDAEFVELGELLHGTQLRTEAECAGFALFAAEWLRRRFDGGIWSWQGIFAELSIDLAHPPYDDMQVALRRCWGVEVVKLNGQRRLLGTLLIQGGLPLRAVERDGNALRRVFGKLVDEAVATGLAADRLVELATAWANELPQSWRNEAVYRLLAEISEVTASLSSLVPEGANPIEHLDEASPAWRESLPLSLTDEVGRALFSFMVTEAHESAALKRASLRVVTLLAGEDGDWLLERRMQLPQKAMHRELLAVLGVSEETSLPYRIELYAQNQAAEQQHLATATLLKRVDGEPEYLIEARGRGRLRLTGSLDLLGVSGVASYGPAPLDGGEERGPLPWVFRKPRAKDFDWELVAQGSVKLRADEALVALSEDSVAMPAEDGSCEEAGTLGDRSLIRMRGSVRILADGEQCRLQLGCANDDVADYSLSGTLVDGLGNREPVFRGPPQLRSSASGQRFVAVQRGHQEWRRTGAAWSRDPNHCLGRIELRHLVGDETMYVRGGLHVVPAGFSYSEEPERGGRGGLLRVVGVEGAISAEISLSTAYSVEKLQGRAGVLEWRILATEEQVPRHAELRLNWRNGASSQLKVPLPITGARFITVDGRVLDDGAHVSLDEVHRVAAEVIGAPGLVREARLIIRLYDPQLSRRQRDQLETVVPVTAVPGQPGIGRIELSRLLEAIRLRFSASKRPEARVELLLDLQGQQRRLKVQRFRHGVRVDRDTLRVSVEGVVEGSVGELRFESFPVDQPAAERLVHARDADGAWIVEPESLTDGLRLGVVLDDGRQTTSTVLLRPMPAQVVAPEPEADEDDQVDEAHAERPEPSEPRPLPTALAEAARLPTLKLRLRAFEPVIRRLADHPEDPDWKVLDRYTGTLGELHASSFDVIEALIEHPRAVVTALLRTPARRFDHVWSALEDLPFAWHTVPVVDWVRGQQRWCAWLTERMEDRDPALAQIERLTEFIGPRLPGGDFVFQLARHVLDGQAAMVVVQLEVLTMPASHEHRMAERNEARVVLIRDVANRASQIGKSHYNWPVGPCVSRLVEQAVPALIPELADLLFADTPGFQIPLLNAPVIAALLAVAPELLSPDRWNLETDIQISRRELLFELRNLQHHAPRWYHQCFEYTLVDAIARRRHHIFAE